MYKIDENTLRKISAKQFCNQFFNGNPKPVIFWDTCALLNIIRFIYREDPGDVTTFDAIKKIHDAILNNEILSVSCESVITEYNNNVNEAVILIEDSVAKTDTYYKNLLEVINKLDNTAMVYTTVRAQQMPQKLHSMVDDILHRTSFITIDKTATSNAHQRVLQKKAPAGKKEEFKDCTIWEVMLSCYRQLNTVDGTILKVFYTVNTQDFCKFDNKKPQSFLHDLLMESFTLKFTCCKNVFEVVTALGL